MKRWLPIPAAMLLIIVGAWVVLSRNESSPDDIAEIKTAHYESNAPAANSTLPLPPPNVTIDFNFDLAQGSKIEILNNGSDYGSGETSIDANRLAMRRDMKQDAPDGNYQVKYKACWPDGSCHDGQFSFSVERSLANSFTDRRGQKEITVKMSDIKFAPMNLRISKGTKVTWINDDTVDHFVNTDSHPAHTHVPQLNSRGLKKGQTYSYTFKQAGSYPYHCSAHAANMTGTIIVE